MCHIHPGSGLCMLRTTRSFVAFSVNMISSVGRSQAFMSVSSSVARRCNPATLILMLRLTTYGAITRSTNAVPTVLMPSCAGCPSRHNFRLRSKLALKLWSTSSYELGELSRPSPQATFRIGAFPKHGSAHGIVLFGMVLGSYPWTSSLAWRVRW